MSANTAIVILSSVAFMAFMAAAAAASCLPPSDIPVDLSCPRDNVSRTLSDPNDCSRFYECYNGCISHLSCPQGKLYQEENSWCEFPSKVSYT
jgi:hypothetical protein